MAIIARWPTMVMGARLEPCTTMGTNSKACIRRGKTKGEESLGEEGRSGTKDEIKGSKKEIVGKDKKANNNVYP